MPRRGKTDANQEQIVQLIRSIPGVSVAITSGLGHGFPDLVVGFKGVTQLWEIKDGRKPRYDQQLTPDEKRFHENWRGGAIKIINTEEAALAALGLGQRMIRMQPGQVYRPTGAKAA